MNNPKIGIILGSASDASHAKKIGDTLTDLAIPFEVTIASAHRTPEDTAPAAAASKLLSPWPAFQPPFPAPWRHRPPFPSSASPLNRARFWAWMRCSPRP